MQRGKDIMWNKLSLRIKITAVTVLTLSILCAGLTFVLVLKTSVFYDPIAYAIEKRPIDDNHINGEQHNKNPNEITIIDEMKIIDEIYLGSLKQFKTISILTAVGVVLVGAFLTWLITGKTLRPLRIFADRVEEIDENNLSEQILLNPGSNEISRLTDSFNNMLEKLGRAFNSKKLFASNAAHELKTPLTSILTNIEVMQMDDEPSADEYKEVIAITKDNIERLTVLIQDLLDFNSELDDKNIESIRTDTLFEKILTDLSAPIHEKNIKATTKGYITIKGDKNLLERAFFNIVQNAIKYNKENGDVRITAHDDTIIIEDTGIGIPNDSLTQVFDPFYCVDKSRSRKLGGSGLGLSIAKQIIDKHNMKMTATSEPGKGTKIFIKTF